MNEETPKHPGGAPTKYRAHFPEQARKLALLGASDDEMADFFDVHRDSISEWKSVYPEFSDAIREGKVKADSEIANSLYDRAKGAEWTENVPVKLKKTIYENGKKVSEEEEVQIVAIDKKAPPDTQAASLWLRNRRPKDWRDTQHIEQTVTPKKAKEEYTTTEEAAEAYSEIMKE